MAACHMKPADKKKFISNVGKELVKTHGKKKYYKSSEVRLAADNCGYSADIHCWALCFFTSPSDFNAYHVAESATCNYTEMRTELLTDISSGSEFSLLDIDLSWLDWPDIDLSSIFDWFDFDL